MTAVRVTPRAVEVSATKARAAATPATGELVALVKARVIARLGTEQHNALLDQIIPQVLARITASGSPVQKSSKDASY